MMLTDAEVHFDLQLTSDSTPFQPISETIIMLCYIIERILVWRGYRNPFVDHPLEEFEVENELYAPIVRRYFVNVSTICNFHDLLSAESIMESPRWRKPKLGAYFKQLKPIFKVPRLNKFHETQNRINNCHLLEAFLSLLLQLLYHKTDRIVGPFRDGIDILEKELRFLLTILGDMSWMLCHTHEYRAEFHNLLPEFEAAANQAGSFVHYLFFSADQAFERTDEILAAVLNQTDLLNAILQSSITASAYTTPMTSVVDSFLILHSIVDDLQDLLKRKDDPLADVKDQVNLLHEELLISHSSIKDTRSPQPSEIEELKDPLMRIGGIAHQAQYLITSFLVNDAPLWYVSKRLSNLSHRIQPIRTELQQITQNYRPKMEKYNFSSEPPLQDKGNNEFNDVTVGFEDKTIDILDQLVGGTRSLQIISILGMPGLGKTTLANKLYNHPSVRCKFDKLAWCVVSQSYKIPSILANILSHINVELEKDNILKMDEISLVEQIHKTLMKRRYLIVFDDIWDSNVLDALLRCFPDDGNGSKILFTSRNKDVPTPNSIINELPFLSDEQCWELLEKKVFGNQTCPPELQDVGKKIAVRCCGLPLTVVVIAGVLSSVDKEERIWEEVRRSIALYIDGEDSVMQILDLSYKHLPDYLKPCFLYFGEFKEDEALSVGELKRLWVAEGFIPKEKKENAENIAGEYLVELINRSLVMIAKRRMDERGAKSCVVHDLLRDLCLKKCKEESFLKYRNIDYSTIFEEDHRVQAFGETATLSYCQHVRSFVGNYQSSPVYVRDMRLLRVLHFKFIGNFDAGTFGVEYLVNLRFLVIGKLPTGIDRLLNLEYLRVENWETVVYLPPKIVEMKELRYIRAKSVEYGEDWNISNQTNNLEYLSGLTIKKLENEELLKCSPHLRKLKCTYDLEAVEKSVYPHFDLRFLTQLNSLSLLGHLRKGDFRFPSNIRELTLGNSSLRWEKMSIVGRLENLEVLKLSSDAFVGRRWDTRDDEFQNLRFLQLKDMQLSEWNVDSSEHFPKLQQLILISCEYLQEIPGEIGDVTALELIEVKWLCQESLVKSAERIKEEQQDMGNEELRLIIDDIWHW